MSSPYTVCLVCTANMCRSAMAQGLLADKVARAGLADRIVVTGGGTRAGYGYTATSDAVTTLAGMGLDISGHASRPADRPLLEAADIVLTATRAHANDLKFEFPDLADKIHTLCGFGRPEGWRNDEDVDDPVGRGPEAYQRIATLLERELERIWPLLLTRAGLVGP